MTAGRRLRVAVNARYAARPVTGVERYATELTTHLSDELDAALVSLRPDDGVSGARGHLWEQVVLPPRFRATGADVLLSPCNVGPVAVRNQVVVVHDVAPFLMPESFSAAYRNQVRVVQRLLAKRCTVATVSERSRNDVAAALHLAPGDIGLVPPAVGVPFLSDSAGEGGRRCLFVGGHDERKNLALLLPRWTQVHAATGLELHVVGRSSTATLQGMRIAELPGVRWHSDVDDVALADLYRSALCVLSPSRYEGFGLPLLEGMACGTPFLASDTGAARELAVRPEEQLLPLDADAWVARLLSWATADLRPLRAESLRRATGCSWTASAQALAALLTANADQGAGRRNRSHRSAFSSSTRSASDGSSTSAQ